MPEFVTNTLHDRTRIAPEDSHAIHFRPGHPGLVRIVSEPLHRAPSETPFARLVLRLPGNATPLMTPSAGADATSISLSYTATADDLAVVGDWTCQVINVSDQSLTFDTDITYMTDVPVRTASFDMGLLNLLLTEAATAAAIKVHLQSGPAELSNVSWSDAVARVVRQTSHPFHLDDVVEYPTAAGVSTRLQYRIEDLNSDPRGVRLFAGATDLNFPYLSAAIYFETRGTEFKGDIYSPDVDLRFLSVVVTLFFDGTVKVTASVDAVVAALGIDVSERLGSPLEERAEQALSDVQPLREFIETNLPSLTLPSRGSAAELRRVLIDHFFGRLMRLGDAAHVLRYVAEGQHLVVSYYTPGRPTGVVVTPSVI